VRLTDLLSPRRVVVPLSAASWAEGVELLLQACVADGRVADPARLAEVVREAWPADTLTLGPHAFLPHFRSDAVAGVVVALGVAPEPMAGTAPDGHGARIMLLVVAPPREAAAYLQTVAAFGRALARAEVVEALHAARTPAEVLAIAALREVRLEGQLLVRDVLPPNPLALAPDAPLEAAARQLLARGLDAAPVVGPDREVIGLLSTRDLLRVLGPGYVQRAQTGEQPAAPAGRQGAGGERRALTVRDAMARNVLCVSEDQSVAEVATLLADRDVTGVPVVREGRLRGYLTRGDVVRTLVG